MPSRYTVTGAADTAMVMRVLGLFAQQDLAVAGLTLAPHPDGYELVVDDPSPRSHRSEVILEKIGAMVLVTSVRMQALDGTARVAHPAPSTGEV